MKDFLIGSGLALITGAVVITLQILGYQYGSTFFLGACVMATYLIGRSIND